MKNDLQIPFVKPVRVGNFKLWRSRYTLKSGKDKQDIDCLHVSNLDGSWMVRIPSTTTLFSVITSAFATADTDLRNQFLENEVFQNLEVINTSGSVVLHHSFSLLFQALHFPIVLMTEKELTSWVKKNFEAGDKKQMKRHLEKLLDERHRFYEIVEKERKDFLSTWEEQRANIKAEEENAQKQLEQDEIAEQAFKILSENDN